MKNGSSKENPIPDGFFLSSNALFLTATRAYVQAAQASPRSADRSDATLTAILFSAIALEAYINETYAIIRDVPYLHQGSPKALAFAEILDEAERGRASVRLKYLLAKAVLAGKPFDRGAQPYQDFDLLMTIRDEIMHYKLQKVQDTPKIVARLESRNIPLEDLGGAKSSLPAIIGSPAVAKWACNTAASIINEVQAALLATAPEDQRTSMLHFLASFRHPPIADE